MLANHVSVRIYDADSRFVCDLSGERKLRSNGFHVYDARSDDGILCDLHQYLSMLRRAGLFKNPGCDELYVLRHDGKPRALLYGHLHTAEYEFPTRRDDGGDGESGPGRV